MAFTIFLLDIKEQCEYQVGKFTSCVIKKSHKNGSFPHLQVVDKRQLDFKIFFSRCLLLKQFGKKNQNSNNLQLDLK